MKVTYDKLFLERLGNLEDDATTAEIHQAIFETETKWRGDAEHLARCREKKDTDSSGSGYHTLCPLLKFCLLRNRNEMVDEMKSHIKKTIT